MLSPVLDALVFLHSNGFVHSRIKPSNILATADQLKLSSDTLFPIGESRKASRKFDAHDAPEIAASPFSPASDVWSLGMTLIETLTQRPLAPQAGSQADLVVPDIIPQPFLDIARHVLRREPRRRWTLAEVAARLNPAAFAAAAGQSVSPLSVPLSPVAAVPAARLQIPRLDVPPPRPQAQPPRPRAANASKQALVLPDYVVPVAAGVLLIVAIIVLPKILRHRPDSSSSASTTSAPVTAPPKRAEQPVTREIPPTPKPAPASTKQEALKNAAAKKPTAPQQSLPATTTAPAAVRTETIPPANAPSTPAASSAASSARGEVLDQVLPDVSEKASATIQGVVRVGVRVKVDPTGNVSEAALDSPGPSPYFADLALKAARRWQFTSPEAAGHSIPSEWLIRFHFTSSGAKAFPTQTAP